jgi:hypothetical protein
VASPYFGQARVVAKEAKPVQFAQLLEYHCHTGDVQGNALPDENRLVVRDEDCVLELELVGDYLGVEDNMHCGGMNVSFSDAYTRDPGAEKNLR